MDKSDDQTYSVFNVDEFIGKTVGRRKPIRLANIQKTGRSIYGLSKFRVCDPGVYRFDSHEEADEWMLKMAIKRAHQAAKS
jgi:hypothetical protein